MCPPVLSLRQKKRGCKESVKKSNTCRGAVEECSPLAIKPGERDAEAGRGKVVRE